MIAIGALETTDQLSAAWSSPGEAHGAGRRGAGFAARNGDRTTGAAPAGRAARPGAVRGCCAALFGWRFAEEGSDRLRVLGASGAPAALARAPEALRGPYALRGAPSVVADLDRAEARVGSGSGAPSGQFDVAGVAASLAADPDGAAFFLQEQGAGDAA